MILELSKLDMLWLRAKINRIYRNCATVSDNSISKRVLDKIEEKLKGEKKVGTKNS